jgi:hypothetical protein
VEKRRFFRTSLSGAATIQAGGTLFDADVHDLSLHGVRIAGGKTLDIGTEVAVSLRIHEGEGVTAVEATGTVAHQEEGRTGIDFRNMDQRSFLNLRRLMGQACGPQQAEAELRAYLQSLQGN